MLIAFDVAGTPAEFRSSKWTGKTDLRVGDEVVVLQSPLKLGTHFNASMRQTWRHTSGEHEIVIDKVRPKMFGGLRPNSFTVKVDDIVVAESTGM